jgi:acetylornithine/N-succinyldiaminopimelate aminotransferase
MDGARLLQAPGLALQRGLLINAPRTDTLRFMPALTVTRQEIDRMIAILDEVLKTLRTEM